MGVLNQFDKIPAAARCRTPLVTILRQQDATGEA